MNSRTILPVVAVLLCATLAQAQSPRHITAGRSPVPTTPSPVRNPLDVRIHKLKNGLTVMLSVNKAEPRIQTLIAVRAGSKNDPADNTGLAHYLEHLLFKGTDRFGTSDFASEKVYLDEVERLYEQYNHTTDDAARRAIYRKIDSVSQTAATFAIANEYDKMVASIGAKDINAFTSFEQTVYVNDIPANQLEKWLQIEGERFRNPVIRLFHTELEAVYEEKNISLDNDGRKLSEATLRSLFPNHPYGTQTPIGTVEHLKNPSIKKLREYLASYYVPNNMAIILSGDIEPEKALAAIEEAFGGLKPGSVPPFTFAPAPPISAPIEKSVYGQEAERLQIAFRFAGAGTHESRLVEVLDLLLAYKTAGFIDLNLKKKQRVQDASSYPMPMKDYTIHYITGTPREGQTLEEVRDLLLEQIEHVKRGEFDDETLKAVIRNLAVDEARGYESNAGRAYTMLHAYVTGMDWEQIANHIDELAKITKKDVVEFANHAYAGNYVIVYKRKGENPDPEKGVDKPEITPVSVNRDAQSQFVTNILERQTAPIEPSFVDYSRDISKVQLKNGLPLYYVENKENGLFTLTYVFNIGKDNDKRIPLAVRYLQFLGTDQYTPDQLAREFFKLGLQYEVTPMLDQVRLEVSGLGDSFEEGVRLFEHLIANAKPDQKALETMVEGDLKSRANAKLNKQTIMWDALRSYAMYGKDNPFTDRMSEAQLKALKAEDIVGVARSLSTYPHKVLYYGPLPSGAVAEVINKVHKTPAVLKDIPKPVTYARQEMTENVVYFVEHDMVQAELLWLSKSNRFDPTIVPMAKVFNEYFGGGMSSVVFQTIRESKALAYATFGAYAEPWRSEDPYYIMGYLGTQADKLPEAIPAMQELLRELPRTDQAFVLAREAMRNKIETERITRDAVFSDMLDAERMGLDHDIRRDIYAALDKMTIDDVLAFHRDKFADRKYALLVLGSKKNINMDELGKHGRIVELTLPEIFGY
jgi:predicted Zn-dependent peptidase